MTWLQILVQAGVMASILGIFFAIATYLKGGISRAELPKLRILLQRWMREQRR